VNAPSKAQVRVAPDADALMRIAAEEVARRAEEAVGARGRFAIALAGGSTPKRLYALLADPGQPFCGRVPWRATHVFFGDERHVPPEHPDSNYGMARAALLSKVPIPPENVHRVRAEETDASTAALDYERELYQFFGGLPRFDLVLLGIGAEGHTASLFPGSPALDEQAHLVAAPWVEKLRSHRITLTLPVLDAAAAVAFLVAGSEKAERVAEILGGRGPELPAARVQPAQGELIWFLDAPAAAQLRP
jgi:6-phosphogluconolactonase